MLHLPCCAWNDPWHTCSLVACHLDRCDAIGQSSAIEAATVVSLSEVLSSHFEEMAPVTLAVTCWATASFVSLGGNKKGFTLVAGWIQPHSWNNVEHHVTRECKMNAVSRQWGHVDKQVDVDWACCFVWVDCWWHYTQNLLSFCCYCCCVVLIVVAADSRFWVIVLYIVFTILY
jgi:hypothetical protein